ncbi:MAG: hypothetical protein ACOYXA_18045 [Bacteroidota bacterium]
MKLRIVQIPFFYFQATRLRTLKDFGFHFMYEWLPAYLLLWHELQDGLLAFSTLLVGYVAFIALYELGYLANDYLALKTAGERRRTRPLSGSELALFIIVRFATFVLATYLLDSVGNPVWYAWYAILAVVFSLHNTLGLKSLKCITFVSLAFLRFFSPLFFAIGKPMLLALSLPIFANYVLFRLISYMNSKQLLTHFDRHTPAYRLGYYLALGGVSLPLCLISGTWVPAWVNGYYLVASAVGVGFALWAKRRPI